MMQQAIKCMLVGDSKVGKTDLFLTFTTGSPAKTYSPTVFDTYTKKVVVDDDGSWYNMGVWDSAGDKLYDEIRPISYPHTDCFILCYSIDDRKSYENIEKKWKPEILRYGDGPNVPIILAGMKSDLRYEKENCISTEEGHELRAGIGASGFFECSTKTLKGIAELMAKSVECAITKKAEEDKPPNPIWGFEDLKILVVGDSTVGKTCIMNAYTSRKPINELHDPTTETVPHYHDLVLDGIEYFLGIMDLPSTPEFLHDRIKEYEKADGVILCYSISDPFSFQNIEHQWVPEIKKYRPTVPLMVLGNKIDLKKDSEILIPSVDGEELMLSIGASAFVECSAKTLENIQDVFIAAVQAFKKSQNKTCDIHSSSQ